MEFPIKIQTSNSEQFARTNAVNMAFRFGVNTNKPLSVSEVVGQNGNPDFNSKAYYGTPIRDNILLKCTETQKDKSNKTIEFELKGCILTVNRPKVIVTTPITGMDGTVKEMVSHDDFQITLDVGLDNYLGNEDNESRFVYPKDKVEKFIELLEMKESINIASDFLQMFKISSVVVKEYRR